MIQLFIALLQLMGANIAAYGGQIAIYGVTHNKAIEK